jgi:hypothetical protein
MDPNLTVNSNKSRSNSWREINNKPAFNKIGDFLLGLFVIAPSFYIFVSFIVVAIDRAGFISNEAVLVFWPFVMLPFFYFFSYLFSRKKRYRLIGTVIGVSIIAFFIYKLFHLLNTI